MDADELEARVNRMCGPGHIRVLKPGDEVPDLQALQRSDEANMRAQAVATECAQASAMRDQQDEHQVKSRAIAFKEEANNHFKAGRYAVAQKGYLSALWLLSPRDEPFPKSLAPSSPDTPRLPHTIPPCSDQLISLLLTNAAAAALKLNDFQGAARACRAVLQNEPHNKKALTRLAVALDQLGSNDAEVDDLLRRAGQHKLRASLRTKRGERKKQFEKLFQNKPLYSQAEQRRRRREAREPPKVQVLDPASDMDKVLEYQKLEERRERRLSLISPADRLKLTHLERDGATATEIAQFYAQAREAEAKRVGQLMTDDERTQFFGLCQTSCDDETLDRAFEAIRLRVDARQRVPPAEPPMVKTPTTSNEPSTEEPAKIEPPAMAPSPKWSPFSPLLSALGAVYCGATLFLANVVSLFVSFVPPLRKFLRSSA